MHIAERQMERSDGQHPRGRQWRSLTTVTNGDDDGEESAPEWEEAAHRE